MILIKKSNVRCAHLAAASQPNTHSPVLWKGVEPYCIFTCIRAAYGHTSISPAISVAKEPRQSLTVQWNLLAAHCAMLGGSVRISVLCVSRNGAVS